MTKAFTKPLCNECPHHYETIKGVSELFVNGKQQDYHPCHKDTHLMCSGAIQRLGFLQAGAKLNGDQINFTHKIDVPVS